MNNNQSWEIIQRVLEETRPVYSDLSSLMWELNHYKDLIVNNDYPINQ